MIGALTRLLGPLTAAERRMVVMLVALMVLGMTLEALAAFLIVPAVALLMQQDLAAAYPQFRPLLDAIGNGDQRALIFKVMLGLVSVYLLKNLFQACVAWIHARFAHRAQTRISQLLFSTYLDQPYTFHLQRNSAQLIRNVTTEASMFAHAIVNALILAAEALVLLGILALLVAVEPVGTIVATAVLGGAAGSFHYAMRRHSSRWGEMRQLHDGLRLQHLRQGLGGVKEVKLLGREQAFLEEFRRHNSASTRIGHYQAMAQVLPRLWLEFLAIASLASLVVAMLAQGRDMATFMPTLGLFAAAAFRLMPSANRIVSAAQAVRYCMPSVVALNEELALSRSAKADDMRRGAASPAFRQELRLAGVSYTYPGAAAPALEEIDMRIAKGEAAGFVGASGSGKSTLIDVVLGLLTPQTGQVLVDGADIRRDLRAWQDQVGYVPQSIYLTDDTLRRNVAFGLPEEQIEEAAVRRAIRAAQLDDFVAGLPQGLDTPVGERGVRLSGGQRQRIGIARALYHDPAVLVLDEATSALDTATESGVMEAVTALHGAKTVLIVAHRLSTVAHCDRLYRLEQGRVVEETVPTPAPAAARASR